jgi:hypothetical protein
MTTNVASCTGPPAPDGVRSERPITRGDWVHLEASISGCQQPNSAQSNLSSCSNGFQLVDAHRRDRGVTRIRQLPPALVARPARRTV